MSFKVNDNRLLKRHTKIWGKVSILMNIVFDSEPVYGDNDKYMKAKIKSYEDKLNAFFQDKKVPKESALYTSLLLTMLDWVIRVSKKYYSLLEESKYEIKENKMGNIINDDLDLSLSDDKTDNESDNETEFDNDE